MWIWKDEYQRLKDELALARVELAVLHEREANAAIWKADLTAQIAVLNSQMKEERARAERAIDSNLIAQNRVPITDPRRIDEVHDPFVEDPEELAAMHKEMKEGGALGLLMRELPENHEWPIAETIGEE